MHDRLHIPHVSVNTNDCEATPCFTHERIFRSVPDRLVIPNISVNMNDCVDRLAVLYMQPWVFALNIPDRFSKTHQPYISPTQSFLELWPFWYVSQTVQFRPPSFLFIAFALIASQTVSYKGLGNKYHVSPSFH